MNTPLLCLQMLDTKFHSALRLITNCKSATPSHMFLTQEQNVKSPSLRSNELILLTVPFARTELKRNIELDI